jgi:hypothetical protein
VPQDAATAAIALLPTVEWLLGDPEAAERAVRDGLAHVEKLDQDFDRALLHAWISGARNTQRRWAESLEHAEIAVRLSEKHGYGEWFGIGSLLALIARSVLSGEPQTTALASAAYGAYTNAGAYVSASHYLHSIALGHVRAGDTAAARRALREALKRARASHETRMNAEVMILQAELEVDDARARSLLLKALSLADSQGTIATALLAAATLVLRARIAGEAADVARASLDILNARSPPPSEAGWMQQRLATLRTALAGQRAGMEV